MARKDYAGDLIVTNSKYYDYKSTFHVIYRPKALGNIFSHKPSKFKSLPASSAEDAVQKYKSWLWQKYNEKDVQVLNEISTIKENLRYRDVHLLCWCVNEDGEGVCHGFVVRDFIYWLIDQE